MLYSVHVSLAELVFFRSVINRSGSVSNSVFIVLTQIFVHSWPTVRQQVVDGVGRCMGNKGEAPGATPSLEQWVPKLQLASGSAGEMPQATDEEQVGRWGWGEWGPERKGRKGQTDREERVLKADDRSHAYVLSGVAAGQGKEVFFAISLALLMT